jgi:hypothetical protein
MNASFIKKQIILIILTKTYFFSNELFIGGAGVGA